MVAVLLILAGDEGRFNLKHGFVIFVTLVISVRFKQPDLNKINDLGVAQNVLIGG